MLLQALRALEMIRESAVPARGGGGTMAERAGFGDEPFFVPCPPRFSWLLPFAARLGEDWPRELCRGAELLARCSTRALCDPTAPTTLLTREDPWAMLGARRSFRRLVFLLCTLPAILVHSFFSRLRRCLESTVS